MKKRPFFAGVCFFPGYLLMVYCVYKAVKLNKRLMDVLCIYTH